MEPATPRPSSPLSLQDKLDQISHERKVLDVLRELMRLGLHDGDKLQRRTDGSHGRLSVLRSASDPKPVVLLDDGTEIAFRPADWHRPAQ